MPDAKVVHALPTKDFFVRMITRDIALRDCIFDLLDNAIDGAHRSKLKNEQSYAQFKIQVRFSEADFEVADNCGGITLEDAVNHAFHFGRKVGAPNEVEGGIGLYGIGMKRAIFKIGKTCEVFSQAQDACFKVKVCVDEWMADSDSWDFGYEEIPRQPGANGTRITVKDLNPGIGQLFGDSAFRNSLIKDMARDYAFFIQKGLRINVCDRVVPSYQYRLGVSDSLAPLVEQYEEDGVKVRILAGLAEQIPDNVPEELRPSNTDRLGWFVICNDRVVLAADKSARTVWGNDNFPIWHGQYAGFAGYAFFNADDQRKLPWTTTKRDVDLASPLYRRAVAKMKQVTTEYIKYSQVRSAALIEAKQLETAVRSLDISQLSISQPLRLPTLKGTTKAEYVNIAYQKPIREVEEIKTVMGNRRMSARDVGIKTFEYFRTAELGKK